MHNDEEMVKDGRETSVIHCGSLFIYIPFVLGGIDSLRSLC